MASSTKNKNLIEWVNSWAEILNPKEIYWCDGSEEEVETLSPTLMLCYLNGFEEAKELLFSIQNPLRECNSVAYQNHKDAMRILRKIKYN